MPGKPDGSMGTKMHASICYLRVKGILKLRFESTTAAVVSKLTSFGKWKRLWPVGVKATTGFLDPRLPMVRYRKVWLIWNGEAKEETETKKEEEEKRRVVEEEAEKKQKRKKQSRIEKSVNVTDNRNRQTVIVLYCGSIQTNCYHLLPRKLLQLSNLTHTQCHQMVLGSTVSFNFPWQTKKRSEYYVLQQISESMASPAWILSKPLMQQCQFWSLSKILYLTWRKQSFSSKRRAC